MIKTVSFCMLAVAIAVPIFAQNSTPKADAAIELLGSGDPLGSGGIGGALPPRPALPGSLSAEERRAAEEKKSADERAQNKKAEGPTEITALQATFDQKANTAVFIGSVVVKDPEFNVNCDKLIAFLKHEEKPQPAAQNGGQAAAGATPKPATPRASTPRAGTPKPGSANAGDPAVKKPGGGGLQRAIAEADAGRRVLITQDKVEADGSVSHSIGTGRKATYDAVTGDVVLTGKPEIQQGINRVIATSDATVMTLNRDGHMRAEGPTKTIIVDKGDGGLKGQ